jgi:hypothetical protein
MRNREFNISMRGWYLYKDKKILYLYQKHGKKIDNQEHYETDVYDFSMTKEVARRRMYTWQLYVPVDIKKWIWKSIEQINKDISKLDLIPTREELLNERKRI